MIDRFRSMSLQSDRMLAIVVAVSLVLGCEPTVEVPKTSHQKFSWRANDFFDDPRVVALCHALESDDLQEATHLIEEGVDVNARGKGNMTALLWAYPDNRPERLLLLLKNGADPNVIFTSNFEMKGYTFAGNSVTHMAAETHFPDYFDIVFSHGGDPNLIADVGFRRSTSPIFRLLEGPSSDKLKKVRTLITLGVDLDRVNGDGDTAATVAAAHGYFDIAIELLNKGANPRIKNADTGRSLVHAVLLMERTLGGLSASRQANYHQLLELLEKQGISIDDAKNDIARWTTQISFRDD